MNTELTGKFRPILACLVPLTQIWPSVIGLHVNPRGLAALFAVDDKITIQAQPGRSNW